MTQERKERLPGNRATPEWIRQKVFRLVHSDQDVKNIQYKINRRPREKLDFNSPKNEFYKQLM